MGKEKKSGVRGLGLFRVEVDLCPLGLGGEPRVAADIWWRIARRRVSTI